jgi:hypothetical protein
MHLGGMKSLLFLTLAVAVLVGCQAKWDEAVERAACENANQGDQKAADYCYKTNKLAHDRDFAGAGEAAKR